MAQQKNNSIESNQPTNTTSNNNNKFETEEFDDQGWTPLHHAAHSGYFKTVNRLLAIRPSRLEVKTEDGAKVTSLWLAFAEGHVETVDTLMMYGADLSISSSDGTDLIDVAFTNNQHRFLVHMMENVNSPEMNTTFWDRLLENICVENMNGGDFSLLETSLTVVGALKVSSINVEKQGKNVLTNLLKLYQPELISDHLSLELTINNIFKNFLLKHQELHRFLDQTSLYDVLTHRLLEHAEAAGEENAVCELIIDILRMCSEQSTNFATQMMKAKRFHNLVEYMAKRAAVDEDNRKHKFMTDCFEIVKEQMKDNETVQNFFHQKTDLLDITVQILKKTSSNHNLLIACLKTLRKMASHNKLIQSKLIQIEVFGVLKEMLAKSNKAVLEQVCKVICTCAENNTSMQLHFIQAGAILQLAGQIKRIKEDHVHEWIMQALFSVAGHHHTQTTMVVKALPVHYVISLATSNSSVVLQYYGCEILNVLLRIASHQVPESASSNVMIHLLNSSLKSFYLAQEKLVVGLRTIQTLAVGVGYVPFKKLQKLAAEKNSVQMLLQVASKSNSTWIELEVYQTIACLLFNSSTSINNTKDGKDDKVFFRKLFGKFPPPVLMRYISHEDRAIQNRATYILAYLLLDKEYKTVKGFRLELDQETQNDKNFDGIGESEIKDSEEQTVGVDETDNSRALVDTAFQQIVLKDSMTSLSPAQSVFKALRLLRQSLEHQDGDIRAHTAHHIAGIARYCPGMKASFTADGFMDVLCDLILHDQDDMVKTAVAVAIASLSRCLQTEIVLFKRCRQSRRLFRLLETWCRTVCLPVPLQEKWDHYLSLTKHDVGEEIEIF